MSVTSRYREAWEGFWREAPEEPGAVFWDAEPALTAGRHLALFEADLTDPGLAMVDLGCGNGTQTRFLAERFPRVVGADLSAAALDHARRADPAGRPRTGCSTLLRRPRPRRCTPNSVTPTSICGAYCTRPSPTTGSRW